MNQNLEQTLARLEPLARELDPTPARFSEWMEEATDFASQFLETLPKQPARKAFEGADVFRGPMPDQPREYQEVFRELEDNVLTVGLNAASPRYLAFVPPGGIPSAAVADFLAALTNRYSGLYAACPGAVEVENAAVGWLRDVVGYGPGAWGTLLSGGTLGALAALVAARDTRPPERWARGVVYRTSESHHSLSKCLKVVGLGHVAVREIEVDAEFRMSPQALRDQISKDRAAGLEPWILIATAGTTNTGAIDPLPELARVARSESLWFHVDGAYGGLFILADSAKQSLAAMKEADSVVLDPHKSLFLPYGCGAVLLKRGELLNQAFSYHPTYLADLAQDKDRSPSDYSPEGTRHFRGLRIWLALQLHGVSRFQAALEEKLCLARYAHEKLAKVAGVEMGPAPQLSCVTFRLTGDDNRTEALMKAVAQSAEFACSSTQLRGKRFVRLCILNFRTHREDVDRVIACLAAQSREIPVGAI